MSPSSYLPLTEATVYILLSLAPGTKHGYAIMKDVRFVSGGHIQLSASTLYTALSRLLEQGLIERVDDDGAELARRPRKAYSLTETGFRVLEAETLRMQSLVSVVLQRLGTKNA
ncbi:MAG: PadR family transcriptional regulator [Anaerolineales bacterium]|nr:PadR family transcriptional regulator [Anaerolineales bacterium]